MIDVVGRGQEIAAVLRWFRETGPPMLVIDGPAGLGKTTVWLEITLVAESVAGMTVVP